MTTLYAQTYYREYYIRNKAKYRIYRKQRYESLKPYYREYYIRNKQKIKDTSYKTKHKLNKNIPKFEKRIQSVLVTFD